MGTKPIVVSKYYRIRMTEELRSMLGSIPVQDITEEPRGDHVYLGLGKMVVGATAHPATVRVDAGPRGMSLTVSAPGAGIRVQCPFETEEDRTAAPEAVEDAIRMRMN